MKEKERLLDASRVFRAAEAAAHPSAVHVFLDVEPALRVDLEDGYRRGSLERSGGRLGPENVFRPSSPAELASSLDAIPFNDKRKLIVVTAAKGFFTGWREEVFFRFDQVRKRSGLLVMVFSEDAPELFSETGLPVARVTLSLDTTPKWVVARSAGRWNWLAKDLAPLIAREDAERYLDHVGWSLPLALSGIRTLRSVAPGRLEPIPMADVERLVPGDSSSRYVDALVFGTGHTEAVKLAGALSGGDVGRALRSVRRMLRLFYRARLMSAESMRDTHVAEALGINVFWWRSRYKPVFARYPLVKIRRRLALVGSLEAMVGPPEGVLEVLARSW